MDDNLNKRMAELDQARERINRGIDEQARHAHQYVTDAVRRAMWLVECEAAVALGKLRGKE